MVTTTMDTMTTPTKETINITTLPGIVLGYISPNPTVVMVTITHHIELIKSEKSISSVILEVGASQILTACPKNVIQRIMRTETN